jgi:hypothetical protein
MLLLWLESVDFGHIPSFRMHLYLFATIVRKETECIGTKVDAECSQQTRSSKDALVVRGTRCPDMLQRRTEGRTTQREGTQSWTVRFLFDQALGFFL